MNNHLATSQLINAANQSLLSIAHRPDIVMERGEGMNLWDTDGKKYLDFIGGWAVTSLGHSPQVIQAALNSQATLLVNPSPSFYNKPMIEFATLLTDISCFDKVFFASSGAEANEGAIKLVRKYGFPLSAMLTRDTLNIFDAGDQGGTYSGQPLAMAVGQAVVREIMTKKLPMNAELQGKYIIQRLLELQEKYQLTDIRGKGLLLAFDLPEPKGLELVARCRDEGLLINSPNPLTIRLMPPLIVSKEDIDVMFRILCSVMV